MRWNQIRPVFPNPEIHLYGAGITSDTHDYFTEAIVGIRRSSRVDYNSSEDYNVLVQGVSTDPLALGYVGLPITWKITPNLKQFPLTMNGWATEKVPLCLLMKTSETVFINPCSAHCFCI